MSLVLEEAMSRHNNSRQDRAKRSLKLKIAADVAINHLKKANMETTERGLDQAAPHGPTEHPTTKTPALGAEVMRRIILFSMYKVARLSTTLEVNQ